MSRYILTLEIEDAFYREFSEQGATEDKLLEQLKLDIQDQVDEFDLQRLITRMMSSESKEDIVSFAPKKNNEREHVLRLPLVMS